MLLPQSPGSFQEHQELGKCICSTECEREGHTKVPPGSAASKTKSQRHKAGPLDISPRVANAGIPPADLMAAAAAPAQALRGPHCSFLRVLQAQLTLATGQGKSAWKLPVRQWEHTTGKEMSQEVSRKEYLSYAVPSLPQSLK